MSFIAKNLSTPFSVRVIGGRFKGAAGTAVAMFADGVYVIHRHLNSSPPYNNAFAVESEIERLDK